MTLQAFYELAFLTGAFQAEAETEWAFQQCVFQYNAFQADFCDDGAVGPQLPGGAGSSKKKHRRIHPREIWDEPEEVEAVAEKTATVAKKLQVRGTYADIPLPDLEYAIAKLEEIVGADYEEDDIEALLLLL